MGAKNQENAGERAIRARSQQCGAGGGTRKLWGANGLPHAGEREGSSSPLTPLETVGFGPEGAKKGASDLRTEWGLSEDLLAIGSAQCAGGVA